jgi:biopolymer transport protein TolQ
LSDTLNKGKISVTQKMKVLTMEYTIQGNSLWMLVVQSDYITKLVLLILLGLSIVCWTIFLYKIILLRIKKNQLALLSKRLNAIDTFDELRSLALAFSDTLPGYFLRKNFSVLKMFLELEPNKTTLQERELASLQHHIEQTIEDVLQVEESYLPFLFTSASVSPLLGLFGTVWGLVHSFIRISEKQSADITTVAPGIAEALITTLAGLLVAIPALVMYHYLMSQVRTIERQLFVIADKFNYIVQKIFVK